MCGWFLVSTNEASRQKISSPDWSDYDSNETKKKLVTDKNLGNVDLEPGHSSAIFENLKLELENSVASLLASPRLFHQVLGRERQITLFVLIMAVGAYTGQQNLAKQWRTMGEYENPQQEQLLEFVLESGKIPTNAVFGGSMPTMATIKLVTKRKIVNHPHYEDTELRDRTYRLYRNEFHIIRILHQLLVT